MYVCMYVGLCAFSWVRPADLLGLELQGFVGYHLNGVFVFVLNFLFLCMCLAAYMYVHHMLHGAVKDVGQLWASLWREPRFSARTHVFLATESSLQPGMES